MSVVCDNHSHAILHIWRMTFRFDFTNNLFHSPKIDHLPTHGFALVLTSSHISSMTKPWCEQCTLGAWKGPSQRDEPNSIGNSAQMTVFSQKNGLGMKSLKLNFNLEVNCHKFQFQQFGFIDCSRTKPTNSRPVKSPRLRHLQGKHIQC